MFNACAQARVSIATFRIQWNQKPDPFYGQALWREMP
jgi:hypothetical protein